MAHGQPTCSLSRFLLALPLTIPGSGLLALPLPAFAALAPGVLRGRAGGKKPPWRVLGVVTGSVASMALVMCEVFWQFDPIVFLAMPWIWLQYLPGAAVGGLVGWVAGRLLASPARPAWYGPARVLDDGRVLRSHPARWNRPLRRARPSIEKEVMTLLAILSRSPLES